MVVSQGVVGATIPAPQTPAATSPSDASDSSDAKLPAGIELGWDKNDATAVTSRRARVRLDGIWRFIPAETGQQVPPKSGRGYLRVPGSWQDSPGGRSAIVAMGGGKLWEDYDGTKVSRAWYERKITIPADWKGRVLTLRFDRVSTDAIVYVNGRKCGAIT